MSDNDIVVAIGFNHEESISFKDAMECLQAFEYREGMWVCEDTLNVSEDYGFYYEAHVKKESLDKFKDMIKKFDMWAVYDAPYPWDDDEDDEPDPDREYEAWKDAIAEEEMGYR